MGEQGAGETGETQSSMTDTTAEDDELLAEALEAMEGSDFYERLDVGEGEIAGAEDEDEDEDDTTEGDTTEDEP
jgi:hypothetical protein